MITSSSASAARAEIWVVSRTRDERLLPGADRLPTVIGLARDGAEACEALLHLSGLSDERIAELGLRSDRDPLVLADKLADDTGDAHDACKFEVDFPNTIDVLADLRAMVLSQQLFGRI